MSDAANTWDAGKAAALEYTWGQYRTWAATARQHRDVLNAWRVRVLILTAVGAILGTLGQTLSDHHLAGSFPVAATTGVLSAIAIALATWFTKTILSPERERSWVRARSTAEALKSYTYLFLTATTPFDTPDAPQRLLDRTNELLKKMDDMQAAELSEQQRHERLPDGPLSVNDYINERVVDQIDRFFLKRAAEYTRRVSRMQTISLLLGVVAAVLGAIGATGWTAGWVAVITTVTAAIAAYLYAERYQYLIVSYQATARQLQALRAEWAVQGSPADDPAKRGQFISRCENILLTENNGWMATWLKGPSNPAS